MRMLNYFINRAGRGLSRSRRSELERAKSLLSKRIRSRNSRSTQEAKVTERREESLFQMLHVIAITLAALAMAPAVAHALELPGKARLSKEAHVTVQQIYYPRFTIAGTF
jgi:hypothetical protein